MQNPSSQAISIRRANCNDIADIVRVDEASFGEADGYGCYAIRQYMDLFPNSFFVSLEGDIITGYGVLGIEAFTKNAWFLALAVLKNYRNLGIGAALTKIGNEYCINNDVDTCFLTVNPKNVPAISIYRNFGFSDLCIKRNYYKKGEDRLLMQKNFRVCAHVE